MLILATSTKSEEIRCKCATLREGTPAVNEGVVRHALLIRLPSSRSCVDRVGLEKTLPGIE